MYVLQGVWQAEEVIKWFEKSEKSVWYIVFILYICLVI